MTTAPDTVRYDIGVDIGGTFTDVVVQGSDGTLRLAKLPTTRANPSEAVRHVFAETLGSWGIGADAVARFVHGTTIATNAVIERKGARIGLLTTEGFRDVLEIGRQNRRQMYDLVLHPQTPVFLAPGSRRREVVERVAPDGRVETPLDEASLAAAVEALIAEGVEAIAVCFLFSFANPAHEQAAGAWIAARHPDVMVSLSSDVDPAFREYERSCATVFDAYVKPRLDRYLAGMESDLAAAGVAAPLQIMQSRGGVCSSPVARRRPVRLFLSGPAAGVVGAQSVGDEVGAGDLISVDIGGTSCDIAMIRDGRPVTRQDGLIDGYAVRVPMVDVNAIGSGGGSIAWIDDAGGLRVGPESAGAEPGPACYGRGGADATVTDASVVLGYIDPAYFAGGSLTLDPALAEAAVRERIAGPLGLDAAAAALGIHRVLNAQMAEGIRLMSISRGIDPRRFALVALGGGGALHATALARELGMTRVLVPRNPGVLSADGLLSADVEHEAATSFPQALAGLDVAAAQAGLDRLAESCAALMRAEGVPAASVTTACYADVCYAGQAHHLEVAFDPAAADAVDRLYDDFCVAHDRMYGHSTRAPARIVNLRVVQRAPAGARPDAAYAPSGGAALKGTRPIRCAGQDGPVAAAIYDRAALAPDVAIDGPAIVEQGDTTTLIEPGWRATVGAGGILVVTREG